MITNNHVIDEKIIKENNNIKVFLNDEKEKINIKINDDNKIYTNKDYDITIKEIKEEKITNFFELDENIFEDDPEMPNETIYIIQYPDFYNEQKASVSYRTLNQIRDEFNILHLCSTNPGSTGSPILNMRTNKVIGVHKESSQYNYNNGTFFN